MILDGMEPGDARDDSACRPAIPDASAPPFWGSSRNAASRCRLRITVMGRDEKPSTFARLSALNWQTPWISSASLPRTKRLASRRFQETTSG